MDAVLARSVGTALRQSKAFGALTVRAGAVAHVRRGVGAFYVSWLESDQAARAPADVARSALDHLREGRLVSSSQVSSTEELRYEERVRGGVAEADLAWRHTSNETLNLVRGMVWVTADGKPRLATAECVVSTESGAAPPAVEAACRGALASVALAAPAEPRAALTALPASRLGADGQLVLGAGQPDRSPPSVGPAPPGAEGRILYRGPAREAEERSVGRWIIICGGALILIALLVNQRARRREAAEADASAPEAAADAEADIEEAVEEPKPASTTPPGAPEEPEPASTTPPGAPEEPASADGSDGAKADPEPKRTS